MQRCPGVDENIAQGGFADVPAGAAEEVDERLHEALHDSQLAMGLGDVEAVASGSVPVGRLIGGATVRQRLCNQGAGKAPAVLHTEFGLSRRLRDVLATGSQEISAVDSG